MRPSLGDRPLSPERVLLHPAWLGSVALLVANDHVFKGSGVLPGLVTGKLSDFAGMLVAPSLLAAVLRMKSRRAVFFAHAAVAVGFALLEVSPFLARSAEVGMGMLGVSWQLWPDLTDLFALPVLFLSWRYLVPAMERRTSLRNRGIELVRVALAAAGLFACVATSQRQEPPLTAAGQPTNGTYAFPNQLKDHWKSTMSERRLDMTSERYGISRSMERETGRFVIVAWTDNHIQVRRMDREAGGMQLPPLDSLLVLEDDSDTITLDGETFVRVNGPAVAR